MSEKVSWSGEVLGVQPRIRLMRSFDERAHTYLGYVLGIRGAFDDEPHEFLVAVSKAIQAKHEFRAGDHVEGKGVAVADTRTETADLYRASVLKIVARGMDAAISSPPFIGMPPTLEVYRERGHRRLAKRRYATKCSTCIWGCEMAVEMIIDHWNSSNRRYRRETFCYGPKSCASYLAGPTRKVPGRNGMSWEEPDWVDEEATGHRGEDD